MAELALSPMPSTGLLVLLLLLSGEPVPASYTEEKELTLPKGITCSKMWQYPRFVARKRGANVTMSCHTELGPVNWLWKPKVDAEATLLTQGKRYIISLGNNHSISTLTILGVQVQDNGIYFCQEIGQSVKTSKLMEGCGTELRVMGFSTLEQMKRRNTLKDGIIMIQTLLIILFIVVPIFLLLDKDDSKSGMEEDHTYEGLNIDQTSTYEDIVTLRTGEVKWSVGEHPGQE